jgi:hypothetical protein
MTALLHTAYLPGVGFIVDPQPADYRKAIRFLGHHPSRGRPPARGSLCDRLLATARRLEWTPRRLREMQERAA